MEFVRYDARCGLESSGNVPEKLVLKSLREMDPEAISEVHARYFPEIYRYARYRLSDPVAAEDVAGEVFVRLLEALHAGLGPSKSLRGWMFGTASNLVNDFFRHEYQHAVDQLPDELQMDGADPQQTAERREELDAVQIASQKLTPDQQHVLALRFGSAFSLEETGKIMGKRPNAIKALQFRALNALRRHLAVDQS